MLWEIEIYDLDGTEMCNKTLVGTESDLFEFIDRFCKKHKKGDVE